MKKLPFSLIPALVVIAILVPLLYKTSVFGAATTGPAQAVPLRLPLALQWLTVVTAFIIKPLYMALSLLLAWFLRRRRASDLSALKWAMVFFFAGELSCAVNYLFFSERSWPAEYLHMLGMVLAFSFIVLAVAEFFDERIVHFSAIDRNCALLAACGKCYKSADVACRLRLVFMFVLPCLLLLCAMPLLVPLCPLVQETAILNTPYTYAHPVIYQFFETRLAPLATALFLLAALLLMLLRRERSWMSAKLLFAAGAGFLSFTFFRLVLFSLFRDNLAWFVIWEEWTELLFVAMAWLFLLVFRQRPLLVSPSERPLGGQDGCVRPPGGLLAAPLA
ncbi:MAG: hypothetical protein NTW95_10585 [Candidatus Aminicenantes bacterium]|nr:hypothetical protein [Candidatus Aminicenantes bacterium]